MNPTTTAPTELTEQDREIMERLRPMCDLADERHFEYDHEDCLRLAFAAGASYELIRLMLANWTTMIAPDYPYATKPFAVLAARANGNAYARGLIEYVLTCRGDMIYPTYHWAGFFIDEAAMELFDGGELAYNLAMKMAQVDGGDLIGRYYDQLLAWFKLCGTGEGYRQLVLTKAAMNTTFVDYPSQLESVLGLPDREIRRVAAKCPPNGLNLVLMGYALASGSSQMSECSYIEAQILQYLERRPHLAPLMWRWVAKGYQLWTERQVAYMLTVDPHFGLTPEIYWRMLFIDERSFVHRLVTNAGWQLVPLGPGLTVKVTLPGGRTVIYRHNPAATWRAAYIKNPQSSRDPLPDSEEMTAEPLQEGDLVLVHPMMCEKRTPAPKPGPPEYSLALMPATPPDDERLKWRIYFLNSPLFEEWRPGKV